MHPSLPRAALPQISPIPAVICSAQKLGSAQNPGRASVLPRLPPAPSPHVAEPWGCARQCSLSLLHPYKTPPRDTKPQGQHSLFPHEHGNSFINLCHTDCRSQPHIPSSYLCCPAPHCPRGWGPARLSCPGQGSPPPSACSSWPRWPSASWRACGPCSALLPGSGERHRGGQVTAVARQTDGHGEGR